MIPIKGMKTIPEFHNNDMMMGAFIGLIRYAWNNDEIRHEFEKTTGINLGHIIPRNPIEAMIDKACGYDGKDEIIVFADWVNVNLWGEEKA